MQRLVVDTNILLHYAKLSDIDWSKLAGDERVEIILVMPVIHELDEKKSDPYLGDRAQRVIAEINQWRSSNVVVRPGVVLRVLADEAVQEDLPQGFSLNLRDDQIIALTIKLSTDGVRTRIVTQDLGMRVKCEPRGLECFMPPPEQRLPHPQSDERRKIAELQRELAELRRPRRAILDVVLTGLEQQPHVTDGHELVVSVDRRRPLDLARLMTKVRQRYPYLQPRQGRGPEFVRALAEITQTDADRYNARLSEYFDEFKVFLEELRVYREAMRRFKPFCVWLRNSGTMLTEEITVSVRLQGSEILECLSYPDGVETLVAKPKMPDAPQRPRSVIESIASMNVQSYPRLPYIEPVASSLKRALRQNVFDVTIEPEAAGCSRYRRE